jgi:hypothetical protein
MQGSWADKFQHLCFLLRRDIRSGAALKSPIQAFTLDLLCDTPLLRWQLALDYCSLGRQRGIIELRLGTNDHPAFPRKVEVRRRGAQEDLAQQRARGTVDDNTVPYARIDCSIGVAVDSVRDARRNIREKFAVRPRSVIEDRVLVARCGSQLVSSKKVCPRETRLRGRHLKGVN